MMLLTRGGDQDTISRRAATAKAIAEMSGRHFMAACIRFLGHTKAETLLNCVY